MKDTLINKLNINQPITITKKMVVLICGVFVILFILIAIALHLSLLNIDKTSNNYKELEDKIVTIP
ncbi:hypothetical protein A9G24_02820 [Gilliamella sp. App6-5]|uniref:hypothetical protein n=1 Tax=Gilliamella sp. App6-5 TaxID=3120232 RepID=UPI00080E788A|nr:hypothetical protein [Gilliamella apicola]OCG13289.1 hypothetical protein A9G24_08125 [Gilliamella apicola]OCG17814.1 hypothetical protein A9G24_02820 [Gilliamella apicola]